MGVYDIADPGFTKLDPKLVKAALDAPVPPYLPPPQPESAQGGSSDLAEAGKLAGRAVIALPKALGKAAAGAVGTAVAATGGIASENPVYKGLSYFNKAADYTTENPESPLAMSPGWRKAHPVKSTIADAAEGLVPIAELAPFTGPVGLGAVYGLKKQEEGTQAGMQAHPEWSETEARLHATPGAAVEGAMFAGMGRAGELGRAGLAKALPSVFGDTAAADVPQIVNYGAKRAFRDVLATTLTDAPYMSAQGAAVAATDKATGTQPVASPLQSVLSPKEILTNTGTAAIFGALHARGASRQLKGVREALTDPEADPAARDQAAAYVYDKVRQVSPEMAANWITNTRVATYGLKESPYWSAVEPHSIPTVSNLYLMDPYLLWGKNNELGWTPERQEVKAPVGIPYNPPVYDAEYSEIPEVQPPAKPAAPAAGGIGEGPVVEGQYTVAGPLTRALHWAGIGDAPQIPETPMPPRGAAFTGEAPISRDRFEEIRDVPFEIGANYANPNLADEMAQGRLRKSRAEAPVQGIAELFAERRGEKPAASGKGGEGNGQEEGGRQEVLAGGGAQAPPLSPGLETAERLEAAAQRTTNETIRTNLLSQAKRIRERNTQEAEHAQKTDAGAASADHAGDRGGLPAAADKPAPSGAPGGEGVPATDGEHPAPAAAEGGTAASADESAARGTTTPQKEEVGGSHVEPAGDGYGVRVGFGRDSALIPVGSKEEASRYAETLAEGREVVGKELEAKGDEAETKAVLSELNHDLAPIRDEVAKLSVSQTIPYLAKNPQHVATLVKHGVLTAEDRGNFFKRSSVVHQWARPEAWAFNLKEAIKGAGRIAFEEGKRREAPDTFRGEPLDAEDKKHWVQEWDLAQKISKEVAKPEEAPARETVSFREFARNVEWFRGRDGAGARSLSDKAGAALGKWFARNGRPLGREEVEKKLATKHGDLRAHYRDLFSNRQAFDAPLRPKPVPRVWREAKTEEQKIARAGMIRKAQRDLRFAEKMQAWVEAHPDITGHNYLGQIAGLKNKLERLGPMPEGVAPPVRSFLEPLAKFAVARGKDPAVVKAERAGLIEAAWQRGEIGLNDVIRAGVPDDHPALFEQIARDLKSRKKGHVPLPKNAVVQLQRVAHLSRKLASAQTVPEAEAAAEKLAQTEEPLLEVPVDFAALAIELKQRTGIEKGKGSGGYWSMSDFQEHLKEFYPSVRNVTTDRAEILTAVRVAAGEGGKAKLTSLRQEVIDAFRQDLARARELYGEPRSEQATAGDEGGGETLSFLGTQQLYERLAATRTAQEAKARLETLGRRVLATGARSYGRFAEGMRRILRDIWDRFKGELMRLWRTLKDERGVVGNLAAGPIRLYPMTRREVDLLSGSLARHAIARVLVKGADTTGEEGWYFDAQKLQRSRDFAPSFGSLGEKADAVIAGIKGRGQVQPFRIWFDAKGYPELIREGEPVAATEGVPALTPDLSALYEEARERAATVAEPKGIPEMEAEIRQLKPRVEKAYEAGEHERAEELDARLEDLYERLDAALEEADESEAQDNKSADEIDREPSLEETLADSYGYMVANDLVGYSREDAIGNFRDTLRVFKADREGEMSDDEIMAAAKDAYEQVAGRRERPAFARGPLPDGRPLPREELDEYVKELLHGARNKPPFSVIDSTAELPFAAPADVKGALFQGTLYLVAPRIRTTEDAKEVIAHEIIGHYGLRGFFGTALHDALDLIHKHNPLVRDLAEEWKNRNTDLIRTQRFTKEEFHYRAIEEAMAELAEQRKPFTFALRFVRIVQSLLRKAGLEGWANRLEVKHNAEALQTLRKAELFVKRGATVSTPIPDPLYPLFALSRIGRPGREALPHLVQIGERLYREGADTFRTFAAALKRTLGTLWGVFKRELGKVWHRVRKLVDNERGGQTFDNPFYRQPQGEGGGDNPPGGGSPGRKGAAGPEKPRAFGERIRRAAAEGARGADAKASGASPFYRRDVRRKAAEAARGFSDSWDGVKAAFHPGSRSADAEDAARTIVEGLGRRESYRERFIGELNRATAASTKRTRNTARLMDLLKSTGTAADAVFNSMSKEKKYDFIANMQHGRSQATPELDRIAAAISKMFEDKWETVERLTPGAIYHRENFFPGMWKREREASAFFQAKAKRPFEGSKAAMKKKVFADIWEGIEAGFEPISDNPLDLAFLRMEDMDKYVICHSTLQALAADGAARLIRPGERIPEGWQNVDGRYGIVTKLGFEGPGDEESEPISYRYIVREDVAQVVNNYLSPTLYSNRYVGPSFRAYMGVANSINQFQLGVFSAFHAGFTSMEAVISHAALGVKALSRGDLKSAGKFFLESPGAFVNNAKLGDAVLKAWRGEGAVPADMAGIVTWLELAGARRQMDKRFWSNHTQRMLEEWANGNRAGAVLRSIPAIVEQSIRPIMEYIVPRQKFGVFAEMAHDWVVRHPEASHEELRAEMQRIWNRVDSRLGQVVYDRLFVNNAVKNVIQGLIRAPGWTGGTILEVGGGLKDLASYAKELARGKRHEELSDRAAYVISMALTTALVNGALTALFTGKAPTDPKDYVAFRTGQTDEHGDPERFMLPTYGKDVYAYSQHPGKTLLNKSHPMTSLIAELSGNRDYFGTEIRHEGDPVLKQAGQLGLFVAKTYEPFWMRGGLKESERGGSLVSKAAPLIGVMPAPSEMNRTPAEKLAHELAADRMPKEARTQTEAQNMQDRMRLTRTLRSDPMRGMADLEKAVATREVSRLQARRIEGNAKLSPLQATFKGLDLPDAERVYAEADERERRGLKLLLAQKRYHHFKNNPGAVGEGGAS